MNQLSFGEVYEDEKKFFKIIKIAFMQKRKTLVNALINGGIFKDRIQAEECLKNLNIDTKIRGEKLTLEQYNEISKAVYKKIQQIKNRVKLVNWNKNI